MNHEKRVARGRIFRVTNLDRKFGENLAYNLVHVEDCRLDDYKVVESETGGATILPNEYCLLFTDSEIAIAKQRAERNKEDIIEKGFMTDLFDDLA